MIAAIGIWLLIRSGVRKGYTGGSQAMEPEGEDDTTRAQTQGKPPPANWGVAFDLGMRLGISVVLGLGAGLLLDNWLAPARSSR